MRRTAIIAAVVASVTATLLTQSATAPPSALPGFGSLATATASSPRLSYTPTAFRPHRHRRHRNDWQPAVASVYNDAGPHGCALHATYGVANKELACGTHVSFRYHGRQVGAIVDDRGPYVAGRDYDLSETTQEALGFPMGVDSLAVHVGRIR